MLLLLFIAAFATDLGAWYRQGQAQQQAADVSSLNGVQAYDREVRAYLESFGPETIWDDLTEAQREEGERRAMLAVVNTVIGLLETSGLDFSNPDLVDLQLSIPPNMLGDESIATIEADDGTVVTIVRSVIEVDGVFVSTISVSITAPGQQFISGILRDAPDISSSAESTVSNCGAECEREVTIDPPFAGFNAGGSGDGFSPLLFGDDQIWAVNHHANNGINNTVGDIVCVDRNTEAFCGTHSLADYHTPVFPAELLAEDFGKIYFPATQRNGNRRAGLGCFDVARGDFCDTEFIELFPGGTNRFSSAAGAVFRHGDNAWVLSHFGQIACVTMSADADGGMTSCGTQLTHDTIAFGTNNIQGLTQGGDNRPVWGTVQGNELFATIRNRQNRSIALCFNFDDQGSCGWAAANNLGVRDGSNASFEYFDTTGGFIGICAVDRDPNQASCAREDNGLDLAAPPNIATTIAGLERNGGDTDFIGSSFVWNNQRLFINGGISDRIVCYDFAKSPTPGPCAQTPGGIINIEDIVPQELVDSNPGGGGLVEPYQLAEVTSECLIGLGDESVFFSLNPIRLTGCVDTITSTIITPCLCTGTGIPNWAAIELPQDLLDSVNLLEATARDATVPAGSTYVPGSGAIVGGIQDVDVLQSGVVDLGNVPDSVLAIELVLRVDSKIDPGTQLPEFDAPATFDISIISQPTLTN